MKKSHEDNYVENYLSKIIYLYIILINFKNI